MYYLKKEITIAGAHSLKLNYDSPCKRVHGHNWRIVVYIKGERLNEDGMLIDFSRLKKTVEELDHKNFNDYIVQPTAENIAFYLFYEINEVIGLLCGKVNDSSRSCYCFKVDVIESEGSEASYAEDL